MTIHDAFKQWCKETGRSGGVLVGRSLREFFEWYELHRQEEIASLRDKLWIAIGKSEKSKLAYARTSDGKRNLHFEVLNAKNAADAVVELLHII